MAHEKFDRNKKYTEKERNRLLGKGRELSEGEKKRVERYKAMYQAMKDRENTEDGMDR